MESFNRKKHWEDIYQTKALTEVSWYQPTPETSLDLINDFGLPKDAAIIDVGGGDSLLAEHLVLQGYTNITVLDISASALERAKKRMGKDAEKIKWIVTDITEFQPTEKYDLWHDRATFHFLTSENDVQTYLQKVNQSVNENGKIIIGTFSEDGPLKCSGIEIQQYNDVKLSDRFANIFKRLKCFTIDHLTPSNKIQNFIFCTFSK